jgi:hypothetical protein
MQYDGEGISEWLFNGPCSETEVKSAHSPVKHFVAEQACSLKKTIPRIGQAPSLTIDAICKYPDDMAH